MRVALLGPLEVTIDGRPCVVAGGRLRALLSRLAVAEGRVVSIPELVAAVWPDDPPAGGANALQSLVSGCGVRSAVPDAVIQVATGYRPAIGRADLDSARFGDLVREARRQLQAGAITDAIAGVDGALQLWRGEPLADAGKAEYAAAYRSGWQALRQRAAEDRVTALLRAGRFDDAVSDA